MAPTPYVRLPEPERIGGADKAARSAAVEGADPSLKPRQDKASKGGIARPEGFSFVSVVGHASKDRRS